MANDPTEFKPIFEQSETEIKDRVLAPIRETWRAETGDFMYDAVAPAAPEIKQLQANQDTIFKNSFALFAEGEFMDYIAAEANVYRAQPEAAKGHLEVDAAAGVEIPTAYEVSTVVLDADGNPIKVTVDQGVKFDAEGTLTISVTTTGKGAIMNVPAGSEWIFNPPIPGVKAIRQPGNLAGGRDLEDTETLRQKWKEKRQKPVRSGNKQNYIAWALEVTGVGAAKCIPRWAGKGTVKVIIIDTEYKPATAALVDAVQDYIDPDQTGDGNGQCPIGAVVTVESAAQVNLDVAATLTLAAGSTLAQAQAQFLADFDEYISDLVKREWIQVNQVKIVYTKIAALLSGNTHVDDYTGLTLNGGTANITLAQNEIPARGTVTLT